MTRLQSNIVPEKTEEGDNSLTIHHIFTTFDTTAMLIN